MGRCPAAATAAIVFTKALDSETIHRHVTGISCEYMSGQDDLAYTMNFVGAVPSTDMFDERLGEILGLQGDFSAWTRTDLKARTTKTSMRGGPDWAQVKARLTVDADTGLFIKVERSKDITRNCEHALLYGGERNIMTILLIYDENIIKQHKVVSELNGRSHG